MPNAFENYPKPSKRLLLSLNSAQHAAVLQRCLHPRQCEVSHHCIEAPNELILSNCFAESIVGAVSGMSAKINKDPRILILDEATSSLDSESESLVQQALDVLMRGRTSVIIAHRLSTIKSVDCIYVLENGSLAEEGTHEKLKSGNGLYSRLCEKQSL